MRAKAAGQHSEDIKAALLAARWSTGDVEEALQAVFPVSVLRSAGGGKTKTLIFAVLLLVVLLFLSGGFAYWYFGYQKSGGRTYSCRKNSNCPLQTIEDCGGELCVPQILPYCDNGQCRTPRNFVEWKASCMDKNTDSFSLQECLGMFLPSLKKQDGEDAAFKICNQFFVDSDDAEACRFRNVCGFDAAYPDISPGNPECIKKAKTSSCNDGRRNGRETGIDCGGLDCTSCQTASACSNNSDCQSGVCGVHGTKNQDICYTICSDGPISQHEPCGCFQYVTPQGKVNKTPTAIDSDIGSSQGWENAYGNGKRVYCCGGKINYLSSGQDCTNIL